MKTTCSLHLECKILYKESKQGKKTLKATIMKVVPQGCPVPASTVALNLWVLGTRSNKKETNKKGVSSMERVMFTYLSLPNIFWIGAGSLLRFGPNTSKKNKVFEDLGRLGLQQTFFWICRQLVKCQQQTIEKPLARKSQDWTCSLVSPTNAKQKKYCIMHMWYIYWKSTTLKNMVITFGWCLNPYHHANAGS